MDGLGYREPAHLLGEMAIMYQRYTLAASVLAEIVFCSGLDGRWSWLATRWARRKRALAPVCPAGRRVLPVGCLAAPGVASYGSLRAG